MGIFVIRHINVTLVTMIDFQVFIVYTEIGIGREEKLLDHAFLMKKTTFYCYAECIPQPNKTRPLVTHKCLVCLRRPNHELGFTNL